MELLPAEKTLIKDAVDEAFKQTITQLTRNVLDGTMPSKPVIETIGEHTARRRILIEKLEL